MTFRGREIRQAELDFRVPSASMQSRLKGTPVGLDGVRGGEISRGASLWRRRRGSPGSSRAANGPGPL